MSEKSQSPSAQSSHATARPAAIPLPERRLLALEGAEVSKFLQGVLTADIAVLAPGEGTLAAILTPQGKIIADLLVFNASDADENGSETFLIDVLSGLAGDVAGQLDRYRLRAQVEILELGAEIAAFAVLDAKIAAGDSFYSFPDPRHAGLGQRLYGPASAIEAALQEIPIAEPEAYHTRRVALGVPECGKDYMTGDIFPHEALLDQLRGVDFKKGCYVGQEVVSRMEHRGTARSRMLPVVFTEGFGVLGGSEVRAGEMLIGRCGECYAGRGIATLRLDKLEDALAKGEIPRAGGAEIRVLKPDFAQFSVAGA